MKRMFIQIMMRCDVLCKLNRSVSFVIIGSVVALLSQLLMGCTTMIRLQAKYDDELVTAMPNRLPNSSPPQDIFEWGQIDVTATIVQPGGGSKQVKVVPKPTYFSSGKYQAFVLNAFSDAITTSKKPGVRGGVTVNFVGHGSLMIAVLANQNGKGDPLGGFLFGNHGIPSLGYMTSQNLIVNQNNMHILNSTGLSSYTSGQQVKLNWSINQDTHQISLGATPSGGTPANAIANFEQVASDGTQNTPIQKIRIMIYMYEAAQDAQVFFDDFFVEEY